jgi:hypothetical protein
VARRKGETAERASSTDGALNARLRSSKRVVLMVEQRVDISRYDIRQMKQKKLG